MDFLRSLWKPKGSSVVPEYNANDGVDLLVKALVYMFKRLDISNSQPLERHVIEGMTVEDMLKLDSMYNIDCFEKRLLEDPHRVLVDWPKNKFRSMLILAHLPQMETLPPFDVPHFRFVVLEADASNDEYIRTLSTSDIYIEHNLPIEVRREIAATVLRKHKSRDIETRSEIISDYLKLIATEIQVARIYKAMLSKMQPTAGQGQGQGQGQSQTKQRTSPTSPDPQLQPQSRNQSAKRPAFSNQASPNRFQHTRTYSMASNSSRTSKLGETPNLKSSNQSTPIGSPQGSPRMSRPRMNSANPNANPKFGVSPSLDAGKKYVLQQARLAVRARIEKEQKKMAV